MARTPPRSQSSARYVALLRGVNVGGRNRLPMADLAALFTTAGCRDVQTYIQSGNVVFAASPALVKKLPAQIGAALSDHLSHPVGVVIRSGCELVRILRENPIGGPMVDPAHLHVAFLESTPSPARIASLDPARSPGDTFAVRGAEIYLHLPGGVARTRLTNAYFDARLGTTSTLRNWRTVQKLAELADPEHA